MKAKYIYNGILILMLLAQSFTVHSKETPQQQNGTILDSNNVKIDESIEQDTLARTKNRISSVIWLPEQVKVRLELESKDQPISLVIYNMLAKAVKSKDIDAGEIFDNKEYVFENTSDLPQGFYFCVLIGTGFRDTKKFSISR